MKIAVFSPSESERKLVAATEKKFGCELKLIDEYFLQKMLIKLQIVMGFCLNLLAT